VSFTTRPELRGTHGMVASTHWLASGAGMAMLERGGNAFDAAVAAGLVLQVVEPHLNGPGGEVPILLYRADRDEVLVIGGQGPAPAAATIEHYRSLGLDLIPGTGMLAATVPGAFDAWMLLARDHGTLGLEELMAPAIGYAEHGYPLIDRVAAAIDSMASLFRESWPTSAATYLPGDRVPRAGALFANPVLAATYARVVEEARAVGGGREAQIDAARDAFYRGFVAEAIDAFVASTEVLDVSGRAHRGVLTGSDLAVYAAAVEAPVSLDYAGHTVYKTGPWGQGPVLLQQLALLSGFDLTAMGPLSADFVHTVVECAKLALADREAWYGDPGAGDVPLEDLLSGAYADERRTLVGAEASLELRPGSPGGREPRLSEGVGIDGAGAGVGAPGAGEPTMAFEPGDTCHVDVADRDGNLVAATPSGGWLTGSPTIPSLGFCLGTRAQMFWLEEGLPSSLRPGTRPRTTLSPSLARRDGRAYLAFGTPGGDMQDQWSLLFFLRHVHFGMNLQEAIDAPAFHTNHATSSFYPRDAAPGEVEIESRFPPETLDELRRRGHRVQVTDPWSLGRVSAAGREADGVLKAAANPRGMQGYAVGR
jgi:gamma-glutamyltranspeptidase / glutathione hydrolase